MQTILIIHNLLRWLVLLFGVWAVMNAIAGLSSKKEYVVADKKGGFFFMLSMDIQLIIGLILYFVGPWFNNLKHLGEIMKDPNTRFFTMEHGLMMIIAWIFVHVGVSAVKKATLSRVKFKRALIYFGIALVLILASIPWPFREAIARPLFRY
ncbi:MAG: hypothetical protein ABI266_01530 [Ginsengibacter sp.]